MPDCTACGAQNPSEAAFCLRCGLRLAGEEEPAATRRTVTVVFADVTGSTTLGEALDPEALRRVMARYYADARTALERHGGTVEKFIGDPWSLSSAFRAGTRTTPSARFGRQSRCASEYAP